MSAPKPPVARSASSTEPLWLFRQEERVHGPLPARELKDLAAAGLLSPSAIIWQEGAGPTEGFAANEALDFASLRASTPAFPDWLTDAIVEPSVPRSGPHGPRRSPFDWVDDDETLPGEPAPNAGIDTSVLPDWLVAAAIQAEKDRPLSWSEAEFGIAKAQPGDRGKVGSKPAAVPPPALPGAVPPVPLPPGPGKTRQEPLRPAFPVASPLPAAVPVELPRALPIAYPAAAPTPAAATPTAPTPAAAPSAPAAPSLPECRGLTLIEVYRLATRAIDDWVDADDRCDLLRTGDPPAILQQARRDLQIERLQPFGPEVMRKLLGHLALMIDNRGKYYRARAAGRRR